MRKDVRRHQLVIRSASAQHHIHQLREVFFFSEARLLKLAGETSKLVPYQALFLQTCSVASLSTDMTIKRLVTGSPSWVSQEYQGDPTKAPCILRRDHG